MDSRFFDIGYQAFVHARRGSDAHTDDPDITGVIGIGDNGAYFGGAYVNSS